MLVNAAPAPESLAVLTEALSVAAADGRLANYLEQPIRLDMLSATAPHPYFILDVDQLSDDGDDIDPSAATYAGWRYLLEVNRRVVALATTTLDISGIHRFGGIGTGPAVSSVVYAVHVADELLRSTATEYRFSAIDVQSLHTVLLEVSSGRRSAFVPVGLATSLHPVRLHTRAVIRRELRRMAARLMDEQVDDEPVGG